MFESSFPRDDETAKLLRDATAFKESGDWDSAIRALAEAKERMLSSVIGYPAETWCKYPLYLQQAGRFEESMAEFDFLLNDLERRARKEAFLDDPNWKSLPSYYHGLIENDGNTIRAKKALAQAREEKKRLKDAAQKQKVKKKIS